MVKEQDFGENPWMSWISENTRKHPKKLKVVFDPQASALEKEAVLDFFPHVDLGDSSEWIWRSRGGRIAYKDKDFTPRQYEGEYFQPGDVVIVNDNYKHYAGEVHVVRLPMKNDGLRNLVGHLAKNETDMLELIQDGDLVVFEEAAD